MKRLLLAILLVALCALPPAIAKPDPRLVQYLSSLPVAHDGRCKVESMKIEDVECLILVDGQRQIIFLILYTNEIKTTHIIAIKDGVETVVWSNASV